ncbi:hypothetical protein [Haloarcula montana]|uniref:hypothetical protein n=1 Tax=Haloarcula montana TaxID=3111776 RepID=UPI002D76AF09|nr:hypothetical protein [Haloarcula sp. GH36]
MSVLESIKETVGLTAEQPTYECDDCGHQFESDAETDSYWFQCPECGADSATQIEN